MSPHQMQSPLSVVNGILLYPEMPLQITGKTHLGGLRMLLCGCVLASSIATVMIRAPDAM